MHQSLTLASAPSVGQAFIKHTVQTFKNVFVIGALQPGEPEAEFSVLAGNAGGATYVDVALISRLFNDET